MIRVSFDPQSLSGDQKNWWKTFSESSAAKMLAYRTKREAGEPCELDSGVWSTLKAWLLEHVFHDKCAYCEVKVSGGSFGDGEHYRPKGDVKVTRDGRKASATLPSGEPHGGYYWLAYDYRNLIPACTRCNNSKSDIFEVMNDHVNAPGSDPDVLNEAECPLLLHPYLDDPSKYLRFGKSGVITAIDGNARGVATIRILGLDRAKLTEERWHTQATALEALTSTLGKSMTDDAWAEEKFAAHIGPSAPFSRAVRDWFTERFRIMQERASRAIERA